MAAEPLLRRDDDLRPSHIPSLEHLSHAEPTQSGPDAPRRCLICGGENPMGLTCYACSQVEEALRQKLDERSLTPPTPSRRRRYPTFSSPAARDTTAVLQMVVLLQQQSGLPISPTQLLEAPWVGSSWRKTSEGWLRDADNFWQVFAELNPEAAKLLDGGRKVTADYAAAMGWPDWTVGEKLEAHHINNSAYVTPIPASVHRAARKTGRPPLHRSGKRLG